MSEQPEPSRYSLPADDSNTRVWDNVLPVLPLSHLPPGWAAEVRAIVREELARAGREPGPAAPGSALPPGS